MTNYGALTPFIGRGRAIYAGVMAQAASRYPWLEAQGKQKWAALGYQARIEAEMSKVDAQFAEAEAIWASLDGEPRAEAILNQVLGE